MERPRRTWPSSGQESFDFRRIFVPLRDALAFLRNKRTMTAENQSGSEGLRQEGADFDLPPATRAFGPVVVEPLVMDVVQTGPSQVELASRSVVKAAMHPDPTRPADTNDLPSLYLARPYSK
jgi:hypothetical protein